MINSNTGERLRQLMEERNLRQIDILEKCKPYCEKFGERLGRNDLSQYVSGKVTPGQRKLTILALALGVSEIWLMGYDDEPDNDQEELVALYNAMPTDNKKNLLAYAQFLTRKE